MGVFDGEGKRITVREEEDDAMWIEEPKKKNKPAPKKKAAPAKKKAAANKKDETKAAAPAFKFPWQK